MRVLCALAVLCVGLVALGAAVPARGHAQVLPGVARSNATSQPLKFSRYERHRRPPPPVRHTNGLLQAVKTEWFDQLLDHYDISNPATWQQVHSGNPPLKKKKKNSVHSLKKIIKKS